MRPRRSATVGPLHRGWHPGQNPAVPAEEARPGVADLLRVENLQTHFRTRDGVVRAVDGVTFGIRLGRTLGLVGESGCGKSVTAPSIMRLIDYPGEIAGGRILFQDKDLAELEMDEMRKVRGSEIAMIFQEPMTSLNPVYTVG